MIQDYEKWIKDKIKQKEGQGNFKEYKPWMDFNAPLRSNKNFVEGSTVRRTYYLASDLEESVFNILDFQKNGIDIKEQVPLLSRDITRDIAHEIGVKHPVYPATNVDVVMTTDLLFIFFHNGIIEKVAYGVKEWTKLDKRRTVEKLAIEREYWRRKGIPYQIITDRDLNPVLVDNLELLSGARFIEDIPGLESLLPNEIAEMEEDLLTRIRQNHNSIRRTAEKFESDYILESGTGIMLVKYLIYNQRLAMDLKKPLNFNRKWCPV